MAGSIEMMRHDIENGFFNAGALLENVGDLREACEDAINEIDQLKSYQKNQSIGLKNEQRRAAKYRAALQNLLQHCDVEPEGETAFECAVRDARRLLQREDKL